DAAEAVAVEYEVLPAVTDVMDALADGAPTIWPDAPNNLALDCAFGDRAAVEAAIKDAHIVIVQTIRNLRTATAFLEPRAAIGSYDAAQKQHTLISGCQGAHRLRHALAACFKVQQERVHVICPDVGGAFGSRFNIYPEQVAVVWAAHRVGRPVKWTGDRSEAFVTDYTAPSVVAPAAPPRALPSTATAACARSRWNSRPISERTPSPTSRSATVTAWRQPFTTCRWHGCACAA